MTIKDTQRSGPARRILDLDAARWLLLAKTLAVLAAASAAIRMAPFRRVVLLASKSPNAKNLTRPHSADVGGLRWAVEAVSRRVPWRTVCFQKGLALHLMLRRRGTPSRLHYGVGKSEKGELAAHVWISVEGQTVPGGDVSGRFSCLVTYPA